MGEADGVGLGAVGRGAPEAGVAVGELVVYGDPLLAGFGVEPQGLALLAGEPRSVFGDASLWNR